MSRAREPETTPAERALLRTLAGRGVRLRVDGDTYAVLREEAAGGARVLATPMAEIVERCRALGLLAGTSDGLALSADGRTYVRRLASRSGLGSPSAQRAPRRKAAAATAPHVKRSEQDDTLAWMRSRKDAEGRPLISAEAFEAGERLRAEYHLAGLEPRVTQSWSITAYIDRERQPSPGGGLEDNAGIAAARTRVRAALLAVGPAQAQVLVALICHSVGVATYERQCGWPQRSGTWFLRLALDALARHYGLLPPHDGAWLARLGLAQWGSADYKPTLDQWKA
jgi:hypothetical protein